MKYNDTEYLVGRFLDDIIRLSLVYVKNIDDAEDIAQQVFVTYLQKNPLFDSEEHAKNWLFKVAVNLSKNHRRTQRATVDYESLENVLSVTDTDSDGPTEQEEAVFRAVLGLRESYKEVIHLYYYSGYDTEEISKLLGITPATVRSRLLRARKAIEKKLKGGKNDD
jgi:RNA polymerase sigma-70 factor (ECF subfamily)